jgi:dolichyl-phosphate-mannose-protein mannosyltransferase
MQRHSKSTSSAASLSLRRNLNSKPSPNHSDDDDITDPRPWETRGPARSYGSDKSEYTFHKPHPSLAQEYGDEDLPLFEESMETRRRFGNGDVSEKEGLASGEGLVVDDQGKWEKGHGAGPGEGGRRGLAPRQRVGGWVSGGYPTFNVG